MFLEPLWASLKLLGITPTRRYKGLLAGRKHPTWGASHTGSLLPFSDANLRAVSSTAQLQAGGQNWMLSSPRLPMRLTNGDAEPLREGLAEVRHWGSARTGAGSPDSQLSLFPRPWVFPIPVAAQGLLNKESGQGQERRMEVDHLSGGGKWRGRKEEPSLSPYRPLFLL